MRLASGRVLCLECHGFEFHPRQLIFLRKSDCLGCAVLLCLVVCLFDLACFFLPSFSSLIKTYMNVCIHVYMHVHVHEIIIAIYSRVTYRIFCLGGERFLAMLQQSTYM